MSRLQVLPLPSTSPPPLDPGAELPYARVRPRRPSHELPRQAALRTGATPRPAVEHLRTTEAPYVQDALALDYDLVDPEDDDRYFDRQRCGTVQLPDVHGFATQLSQALVEVMSGTRPAPQVTRWLSPQVYAVLAHRALVATRRAEQLRARSKGPVVRRVRVQEVADGVAEVTVVVVHPDRVRALALRLTGVDHRWVVTDLVVG